MQGVSRKKRMRVRGGACGDSRIAGAFGCQPRSLAAGTEAARVVRGDGSARSPLFAGDLKILIWTDK